MNGSTQYVTVKMKETRIRKPESISLRSTLCQFLKPLNATKRWKKCFDSVQHNQSSRINQLTILSSGITKHYRTVFILFLVHIMFWADNLSGVQATSEVFTNSFLVKLKQPVNKLLADEVAKRNGFINLGPVS